jgi:hypothetical protein
MISLDPLDPGSVYTSSVDDHAKVGLYRLEVGCSPVLVSSRSPVESKGLMPETLQTDDFRKGTYSSMRSQNLIREAISPRKTNPFD